MVSPVRNGAGTIKSTNTWLKHTESLRDALRLKKPENHGFFSVSRFFPGRRESSNWRKGVGFEPLRNVLFSGWNFLAAMSGTSRSTITSKIQDLRAPVGRDCPRRHGHCNPGLRPGVYTSICMDMQVLI